MPDADKGLWRILELEMVVLTPGAITGRYLRAL
jgi:hypothetical protein